MVNGAAAAGSKATGWKQGAISARFSSTCETDEPTGRRFLSARKRLRLSRKMP